MLTSDETMKGNAKGRKAFALWEQEIQKNIYDTDFDFQHSISYYLPERFTKIDQELSQFGSTVVTKIEPLVRENQLAQNLPRLELYDAIGNRVDRIVHHPAYEKSGNLIYGSGLMKRIATPGSLLEGLSFLFLSAQVGEAGHNCPIACSAGMIRVLQKVENFSQRDHYLEKLTASSFTDNYTGAQFVTEIQGGSDAGQNAVDAIQDEYGNWRITGEKWFCSNANADLILMTARFDQSVPGTKGLGLFLVPAVLETGEKNLYTIRRLKEKIGTRSMATGEVDFHGAFAIPMGALEQGFHLLMENVLHLSRLFNTICVLGMARRAYRIARAYSKHRVAFGSPICNYPLVKENLVRIKVENTALLASIFATLKLQDDYDLSNLRDEKPKLLLRLLANLNKYISALWSVQHIHHSLDVLAGNGTVETFSTIPLLLRDCIICENWEGAHNVLRMQILKDILRYKIDEIFVEYVEGKLAEGEFPSYMECYFEELKEAFSRLKEVTPKLQALQIKDVVDRMGVLFSGIHLFLEGTPSKMRYLDYFRHLHMNDAPIVYDQHYLDLIDAVEREEE